MEKQKRKKTRNSRLTIFSLVVYDAVVVYFSYLLALYTRFYVNNQIHSAAMRFFPEFYKFAPFYTVCSIVIFALFKLYSVSWKYAGINDVNRILLANLATSLIQICGTILFLKRMPLTYYFLGFIIQLAFIVIGRFGYRFITGELVKIMNSTRDINMNVMVIGSGETARIAINQLENDHTNIARPVCILDHRDTISGKLFNGLPVIKGLENLQQAVQNYNVKVVILADPLISQDTVNQVRAKLQDKKIDVQMFTGRVKNSPKGIPIVDLLEVSGGPITIQLGELKNYFHDPETAASSLNGRYIVKSVKADADGLLIEISEAGDIIAGINENWVNEYEKQTGEHVSFF